MTNATAIAALRGAESALTGTVDRAAALVDTIGATALDEAIGRFRNSVASASARMSAGRALLAGLAGELVAELARFADELAEEIDLNAPLAGAVVVPALPAPMPSSEAEETVDLANPIPTPAAAESAGRKGRARRGR